MHGEGEITNDERQRMSFCPAAYVAKAIESRDRQKTREAEEISKGGREKIEGQQWGSK